MTNDEKARVTHAIVDLLSVISHTNVPAEIMREFETRNADLIAEIIGDKQSTNNMRVIGFAPTKTEVN